MAMLRLRQAAGSAVPTRLLYSSRSLEDVIYRDELDRLVASGTGLEVILTLTREQPQAWTGFHRRIDPEMLSAVAWPPAAAAIDLRLRSDAARRDRPRTSLVNLGHEPARIKTERFGPTGG